MWVCVSVYVCVSVSIQYLKDDISTSTSNMLVFIYKSGAQVFTKLGIFIYNRNKETYLCMSMLEHVHAQMGILTNRSPAMYRN